MFFRLFDKVLLSHQRDYLYMSDTSLKKDIVNILAVITGLSVVSSELGVEQNEDTYR